MSEDPKPCPVCGPGTFLHHTPLPKFAIRIECEECGFPGPLAGNYMDTSQIEADNAAIRAWNGVVEQLEAQRKYSAMISSGNTCSKALRRRSWNVLLRLLPPHLRHVIPKGARRLHHHLDDLGW
jgi:ribosomal protein S27AE